MRKNKAIKIFKIILAVFVVAICIGIIMYLMPMMKELSTPQGQQKFKQEISTSGIAGVLMLFGLQVAQIFLIIVPGEPLEILAGMCYGPVWGTIFIMISAGIITTIIFFLVRKFGKKFVYQFCDKRKVRKIEKSKIFQNSKTIEIIMLILFLLPGTPKDLLVYIAGLLPIKQIRFIIISTIARFPSVISSTLAGASLVKGNLKIGIIMYALIITVVGILIFVINKFDKNKITEKAIKEIQ